MFLTISAIQSVRAGAIAVVGLIVEIMMRKAPRCTRAYF
jgi:hypothetical protein